jgi:uncharacterized protein YjbJ (UPF0337 family)
VKPDRVPESKSFQRRQQDEAKYQRRAVHKVKGKVKEKAGQLTNNPDLEGDGQDEKASGKIQKKIGQVEKVLGK